MVKVVCFSSNIAMGKGDFRNSEHAMVVGVLSDFYIVVLTFDPSVWMLQQILKLQRPGNVFQSAIARFCRAM